MNDPKVDSNIVQLGFPQPPRRLPRWASQSMSSLPRARHDLLKQFLTKRHLCRESLVVFKDIGGFVSREGDLSLEWGSLLRLAHRKHAKDSPIWTPGYWLAPGTKAGLSYVVLDQRTLMVKGLQETAAARAALDRARVDTLYGVKVARWSVDWTLYETWSKLDALCRRHLPRTQVLPHRKRIHTEERGQWQIEHYFLSLQRIDTVSGESELLGLDTANEWLEELERGRTRRSTLFGVSRRQCVGA